MNFDLPAVPTIRGSRDRSFRTPLPEETHVERKPETPARSLVVALVALAALLAACGSSSKSDVDGHHPELWRQHGHAQRRRLVVPEDVQPGRDPELPERQLQGITVNYDPTGSGKGKTDLQTKTVDFAGTDSLPKPDELASYQGGTVLYFPTVAAPITVSYNLSGVDKLQLSADTIAKIFQRQITKWDDGAIAADNPGVTLPSTNITVVHRSDSSGTTTNFTKFLTDVDSTDWTLGSGDTVNWPSNTQGGEKNAGVAQIVTQDRRRHRLRRLLRRHRRQAAAPPRSRTRPASSSPRLSPARRRRSRTSTLQRRPHVRPDQRLGCRGLPDHLADVDHRLQGSDRCTRRARR